MTQRIPAIAQIVAKHVGATATQTDNFLLQANDYDGIVFELITSQASGSSGQTLDVYVQCQDDAGNWRDVVHFAQVSASSATPLYAEVSAGSSNKYIGAVGDKTIGAGAVGIAIVNNNLRCVGVIAGTAPDFAYQVTAYISSQSGRT